MSFYMHASCIAIKGLKFCIFYMHIFVLELLNSKSIAMKYIGVFTLLGLFIVIVSLSLNYSTWLPFYNYLLLLAIASYAVK